jgi:hypothetical protein
MSQLDIEILRYEERLYSAVKNNLPEAIIQQYNNFLDQKLSKKRHVETLNNNIH